jgi:phosphatidate cytidylyltransferase
MKRVLTTLALIPFALYSIFWAPLWFFIIVAAAMALLCYFEYSNIVAAHGIPPPGIEGGALGLLLFLDLSWIRIVAVAALTLSLRLGDLAKGLTYAASIVFGAVYIFGAWRCSIDLRELSPNWILFALAINWVGDIAAYYVGRAIGRHKLAPRVSPGKTVEGAVGSLLGALIFAAAFRHWLMPAVPAIQVAVLAIAGNIAGQLGDLTESAIKRGAGMKDSGTLLPGHGGWLDRLDSSLFTLPVIYTLLRYPTTLP